MAPPIQKESPVASRLDKLNLCLAELDTRISILSDRLQPSLAPEMPEPPMATSDNPATQDSSLVSTLDDRINKLTMLTDRLHVLHDRCEL